MARTAKQPATPAPAVPEPAKQTIIHLDPDPAIVGRGPGALQWATSLTIRTPEERIHAEELYAQVQKARRAVEREFDDRLLRPLNEVRNTLLAGKKAALAPLLDAERIGNTKIQEQLRREVDEKRRQEDLARQAILDEQERKNKAHAEELREAAASAPKKVARELEREAKEVEQRPVFATTSQVQSRVGQSSAAAPVSTVSASNRTRWTAVGFETCDRYRLAKAIVDGLVPPEAILPNPAHWHDIARGLMERMNTDPMYAAIGIRAEDSTKLITR